MCKPEDIAVMVYDSLINELVKGQGVPWVTPIFEPGHPCYEAYSEMLAAYERLCGRLGGVEEDDDAEVMINSLLKHGELLAQEMFRYGRLYQKMQDEENPGA